MGQRLSELVFSDFAGSTLVQSVGGWATLAGTLLLGPRKGKSRPGGAVNPMLGSSLPLATIGTSILWLGWFGFNGGSQLARAAERTRPRLRRFTSTPTSLSPAAGSPE